MADTVILPSPTGDPFTRVRRTLALDDDLTLEHRGLLLVLLTRREVDGFTLEALVDELNERREHVENLLHDLVAFGYVAESEHVGGTPFDALHVYDRPVGHRVVDYQDEPPPAVDDTE